MSRKVIHDVIGYDIDNNMIVGILRNMPRQWYYAQVLRMELNDKLYSATSPRSNQDVG